MKIWVRSQHKDSLILCGGFRVFPEIVEVDDINENEDTPFENRYKNSGKYSVHSVEGCEDNYLGIYESEARAIDVLDELQGFIGYGHGYSEQTGNTNYRHSSSVFQMPDK